MAELLQALFEPVYYRADGTPVWPVWGGNIDVVAGDDGEPDDDDDFADGDDGDDGDDDGDDGSIDDPGPETPQQRQEREREEALQRRREASRQGRQRYKKLMAMLERHGIDPETGERVEPADADSGGDDPPVDQPDPEPQDQPDLPKPPELDRTVLKRHTDRAEKRGYRKAEEHFKPLVVRAKAEAALQAANCNKPFDRVVRVMDLEAIEIDPDGQLTGLDDQIEEIRAEFPEWFRSPERRPLSRREARDSGGLSASDVDGAEPRRRAPRVSNGRQLSWVEKASSALDRGRR